LGPGRLRRIRLGLGCLRNLRRLRLAWYWLAGLPIAGGLRALLQLLVICIVGTNSAVNTARVHTRSGSAQVLNCTHRRKVTESGADLLPTPGKLLFTALDLALHVLSARGQLILCALHASTHVTTNRTTSTLYGAARHGITYSAHKRVTHALELVTHAFPELGLLEQCLRVDSRLRALVHESLYVLIVHFTLL